MKSNISAKIFSYGVLVAHKHRLFLIKKMKRIKIKITDASFKMNVIIFMKPGVVIIALLDGWVCENLILANLDMRSVREVAVRIIMNSNIADTG